MLEPRPLLVLWLFPQPNAVGCLGRTELWAMAVAAFIPKAVAAVHEPATEEQEAAPGR